MLETLVLFQLRVGVDPTAVSSQPSKSNLKSIAYKSGPMAAKVGRIASGRCGPGHSNPLCEDGAESGYVFMLLITGPP